MRKLLSKLKRDARGSYLIEFAAISLPLSLFLMGGIELGYYAFAKAKVEGALREVSRLSTTGTKTPTDLDTIFKADLKSISGVKIVTKRKSYGSFKDVAQPEPLVSDVAPLGGVPGSGDCYLDVNGNGSWDRDMGETGIGGSEDILFYGVEVEYPVLFGLTTSYFNNGSKVMKIAANAIIKNEPFGSKTSNTAQEKCIA